MIRRALAWLARLATSRRPLDPTTTLTPRIVVREDGIAYVVFSTN